MQPASGDGQAEAERAIAVLQALLDGAPLPKHLGVPIVSFDGSVSFAGELEGAKGVEMPLVSSEPEP
jgi:hypothetical protein